MKNAFCFLLMSSVFRGRARDEKKMDSVSLVHTHRQKAHTAAKSEHANDMGHHLNKKSAAPNEAC